MPAEPDTFDLLAGRDQPQVPGFVLRRSKIERPGLPDETLRRDRLLDWLETKTGRRAVFVVAEAGFGKTTLLADFSRRTRVRTIWYRLDEDDRDALGFLRYLVAACRTIDPACLQRSTAILADTGTGTLGWEQILDAFVGELGPLGDEPLVVIFDDYHLVEGAACVRFAVERLLSRAPERFTFVFASRRTPDLAVARLRSRDEVAELGRDELRFDASETDQLFRDGYHQPLDGDVLRDLQARTEGWAASLQLVRSAVTGRSAADARRFVRTLSGAEGRLYDYLAEEVMRDLGPELHRFLTRIAVLDEVDATVATVATGLTPADARRLVTEAERAGLLSKAAPEGGRRLHPLVRDFLLAHLSSEIGADGISALHREIAGFLESRSWRAAAHHWAAAGEGADVRRVIAAAVPTIIGTGECATAGEFIAAFPDPDPNPWLDIIRTRALAVGGDLCRALETARQTYEAESRNGDEVLRAHATLNLVNAAEKAGDDALTWFTARTSPRLEPLDELGAIVNATRALADAADDGSIDECRAAIERVRAFSVALGHKRNEGIALHNLALMYRIQGAFGASLENALKALDLLRRNGSPDEEGAASLSVGGAIAHLGGWTEACGYIDAACALDGGGDGSELWADATQLRALYGDLQVRAPSMPRTGEATPIPACAPIADAWMALQRGDTAGAHALLEEASGRRGLEGGFQSGVGALRVALAAIEGSEDLCSVAAEAQTKAIGQQAWYWARIISLARAAGIGGTEFTDTLLALPNSDRAYISILAELIAGRLTEIGSPAMSVIRSEVLLRPHRWRRALRLSLSRGPDMKHRVAAGELLELVGEACDIEPLRATALAGHDKKTRELGRALIRRLAPTVYTEDLGRVMLRIGDRVVFGTEIRRRVLALFCFLLTRRQFAATREQVLDALWPDQDPETAANSLNQTAYFLRRVFEPEYDDATTAGYLRHEADVMWLDPELVRSRSSESWELLRAVGRDMDPGDVAAASDKYTAKFALDFTYEDWAATYRDSIHATYLQLIERAVARDTACGEYDRAIVLAQRAIAVDPEAQDVEVSLLRLYRATGAHAAAAEQYGHYAGVMRDQLGLEAPPLESL